MVFEFLRWRASLKEHKRGLTYKRPHPLFDFTQIDGWLIFLVLIIFGSCAAMICGNAASGFWATLLPIGWLVFCFLHFVHSIWFIGRDKLTDVDFMPIGKVFSIGNRLLMNRGVGIENYYILYSRFISTNAGCEPYKDVTEWINQIRTAHANNQLLSVGSGDTAMTIDPKEIVKLLQTEIIPTYREVLGDNLTRLYLVFLSNHPPILPYDKSTNRSEMREVATVSDTQKVLDYLHKFIPKRVVYEKGLGSD